MKKFITILSITIMAASSSVYAGNYSANRGYASRCQQTYSCILHNSAQCKPEAQTTEKAAEAASQSAQTSEAQTTEKAAEAASQSSASSMEQQVINLVNQERAKNGLSALKMDSELMNAAKIKSEDMSNNNYFSHTSPSFGSSFNLLKSLGISYKTAGENIAKGQKTAEAVVSAWMNSEGHRKNILSSSFTNIGVSYVNGYWTQIFTG